MDHPDIAVVAVAERPPMPNVVPETLAGTKRVRDEGSAAAAALGEEPEPEDEMAAMLGFSGFGGSKKNK